MFRIARFCAVASVMRINHFRYNERGLFVLAVVYLKWSKVLRCRGKNQKKKANLGENRYEWFVKIWPRRQACHWGKVQQQSRSKTTIALLSLLRSKKKYLLVPPTKLFLQQFEESEGGFALSPCSWLLQLTWAGHFGHPRRKGHWCGIVSSKWCDVYNYRASFSFPTAR